ncbi:MAG: GGDEF domain-containing protein [Schwartzia sp.]|nr:GGDEF domain-containing protein [Schwartzia sp. (in: firmicutes)]
MELARKRKYAVCAYLLYIAAYYLILFYEIEPFVSHTSTVGLFGDAIALSLFWIGVQCQPESKRKPWFWFTITTVLYACGEGLWAYYTDFLGIDPNSPSLCDIFYVSNTLVSLYAVVCYVRQSGIEFRAIAFDLCISVFAVGGILYNFVLLPLLEKESAELVPLLINLNMSAVDLMFFVAILLLVFGSDSRHFFTDRILLMGLAFLGFFVVDQITLIFDIYEKELPAFIEPFWAFPLTLLGFVSTLPEPENEAVLPNRPRLESTLEYARVLLPYAFTFCILFLVGVKFDLLDTFFLWAVLLVVLLSLRQIFILLRNHRLMSTIQENEKRLNFQNHELQRLNQKILRDAELDFLTQLANRRSIDQAFARLAPPEGVEKCFGLLLIDVDFFKHVNDTYGHQVGDFVLKQVAACIRSVIRGEDIAGRFGGDEFIVLLPDADSHTAAGMAERLAEKVRTNNALAARNATLSIGCTSQRVTAASYNPPLLLKQADEALYRAKESGRNRFIVYDAFSTPQI